MILPALIAAMGLMLPGCSCARSYLFFGSVRDAAGTGVEGATVTMTGCCPGDAASCTFKTDWAGRWGFGTYDSYSSPIAFPCAYTVVGTESGNASGQFDAPESLNGCGEDTVVESHATLS